MQRSCRKITFPNLRYCCTLLVQRAPCVVEECQGLGGEADFPCSPLHVLFAALLLGQGAGRSCMLDAELIATIRNKYQALRPMMDEHVRRRWAACEALAIGWGGITAVAEATGLSRPTIRVGLAEVQGSVPHAEEVEAPAARRVRHGGGGRHRVTEQDRTLLKDWPSLLEASTRGDPQSPLLWTSKSTRHLAEALRQV